MTDNTRGIKELLDGVKTWAGLGHIYNPRTIRTAPFDFFIECRSQDFDELLSLIISDAKANWVGNQISSDAFSKYASSIKVILLNLLLSYQDPFLDAAVIPLNNNDLQPKPRYGAQFISARAFTRAYKNLLKLGYISEIFKGYRGETFKDKGFRTRIKPSLKLSNLFDQIPWVIFERHKSEETIILKSAKTRWREAKPLDYIDTDKTTSLREGVSLINKVLGEHWYDLQMTAEVEEALYNRLAEKNAIDKATPLNINFSSRFLYRVFSNNSFEDGGRFYGGWWIQIPKIFRPYIVIDQKPTTEVDFSGLHANMLYAIEGIQLDASFDPYEISGIDRDFVKTWFLVLLNKKSLEEPEEYDSDGSDIPWNILINKIIERNPAIKNHFGSGIGLTLQNYDSHIASEVLLSFAKKGYPCLPLHDSFIVHHALRDELIQTMLDSYSRKMMMQIGVDTKFDIITHQKLYINPQEVDENIDTYLDNIIESRWNAWLSYKKHISSI